VPDLHHHRAIVHDAHGPFQPDQIHRPYW
jgi:hypothetical protein